MKKFPAVLAVTVLGAAGFAAAGIASGSHLLDAVTGTTATVATTQTTTTGESAGGKGRKVALCHRTHSKKHPMVTITVSQHAVKAHLRHHDTLGACPTPSTTATAASTTTSATTSSPSKRHGNGNGNGHGGGHGHGKP
jgi:hypothetical protein